MSIRFDRIEAGDAVPSLERTVTREDVRSYADVSGDQNPLHQDDTFAHAAGFDSIIAHGMYTMGHMAACASTWAGPAARIDAISAQFRAPVMMGDRIVAGGRVRHVDPPNRTVTLELWVTVDRDGERSWPIKRGAARIRFD